MKGEDNPPRGGCPGPSLTRFRKGTKAETTEELPHVVVAFIFQVTGPDSDKFVTFQSFMELNGTQDEMEK